MGMSASQARLLSITGRLTNNEFRAQTITNAKLRLAEKSEEASDAYLEALGSKELMFMDYDGNGDSMKINLTPAALYDYAPMKNQYMIENTAGKFLISYTDAQNFETSKDLFSFLKKYDLSYDVTDTVNEKIKAEWQEKRDKLYADFEKRHAEWEKLMEEWDQKAEDTSLYDKFSAAVGKSEDYVNKPESELPGDEHGCYAHALNPHDANSASCYLHVLGHLLDYNGAKSCNEAPYTTTTGDTLSAFGEQGYMGHQVDTLMIECSEIINEKDANGNYTRLCDKTDDYQEIYGVENRLTKAKADHDAGNISDLRWKIEQLVSDYYYDNKGNMKVKPLKQKIVDLAYLTMNWGPNCGSAPSNEEWNNPDDAIAQASEHANDGEFPASELSRKEMVDILINFTDGDLKSMSTSEPPPEPVWTEPDPPKLYEGLAFLRDQEKSQWYTNMWHALNGSDTSNKVDLINFDNENIDYYDKIPVDVRSEYRFIVENKTKDTKQTNYKLIDKNLEGSAEWLEFALEHGIVSLVQAQYYNPDEDSNKTANCNADGFKWNSIVYTSARDIISQQDQQAIAIAEITYKNTLQEIENEDKKHDQDLKRLDAEHTALQTEYESIKEVISKNTDRSFKAFS